MIKQKNFLSRAISAVVLTAVLILQIVPFSIANAAPITARSLTLLAHDANSDGGSKPGGTVDHRFDFTIPAGDDVGSIVFQYCTQAVGVPNPDTCVTPTGLDTTDATLDADEQGITGWTLHATTNGSPYVALAAPATGLSNVTVRVRLDGVVNPTATNQAFYVRIKTYKVIDPITGSPAVFDTGNVAASTATQIVLSGIMPESLVFCTGATVPLTVPETGVPDCANATAGTVAFDQLFSSTDTATATSQMAASTNAGSGYVISANGPTLTSGSYTIDRMVGDPLGTVSLIGVSQFGLNLVANAGNSYYNAFGLDIDEESDGVTLRGEATANYAVADMFKYQSGETIANSAYNGAGGSDAQIYTVSYIVNVPGSQPAGTYVSTLTFICTPTF